MFYRKSCKFYLKSIVFYRKSHLLHGKSAIFYLKSAKRYLKSAAIYRKSLAFHLKLSILSDTTVDGWFQHIAIMDTPLETAMKPALPVVPFAELVAALGDQTRWAILSELSSGEPRMVKELAQKLERSPSLISKHLAMLQRAGMVVTGRGRLWQIPKEFLVAPDRRQVDFGHCLLRLPKS